MKNDELSFKIKVNKNYEELDIVAFSPQLKAFKLLVNEKERPTTQNSVSVIPSWMGGYSVNIPKNSENYCNNCHYYIVLEAGSSDVEVYLFARFEESITSIGSEEPLYSTLMPFKKHCYKYKIDMRNRDKNVIIQTVVFNGSVEMKYKMNELPNMATSGSELLSNDIQTEKYTKISFRDRTPNYGELNFCFKTVEASSYMIKVFFEEDIEKYQHMNFLFKNREVSGYLPTGKTTRYRIIEFNNDSNITVSMKVKNGDPKLYGYICHDLSKCEFNKEEILKERKRGNIFFPEEFSIGYKLLIKNTLNTCHKKIKEKILKNPDEEDFSIPCAALAIVSCEGDDECEFSLSSKHEDISLQLLPKRPHYQIIPYNQTDHYTIDIKDDSISQLNIILNTITGDADLVVEFNDVQSDYFAFSSRESYLPDVVRISKENVQKKSLLGTYDVRVYGNSFSSYSIYYYTSVGGNITDLPQTTMAIENGHIIKDIYEPGTEYKIYSYISNSYDDLDIRITLTPEKDEYRLYVFTDLKTFKYDGNDTSTKIFGYKWTDNFSNEIVISKTDPNFKKGATYYIVVTEGPFSFKTPDFIPKFWIGVTNEDTPFLLYEGVPNTVTLDSAYESQSYWYTHGVLTEPFSVSLNVYYGKVDLYIDFKDIDENKLNLVPIHYLNTDTTYVTVNSSTLKSKCKSKNNCQIYILVKKSTLYDAQYLISAKSTPDFAEFLPADILKTDKVLSGECKNYNILTDSKIANSIFVSFLSGYGDLYIKLPKEVLPTNKAVFPTPKDYEYRGVDYYLGKTIDLNSEKLTGNCNPCQILATVCGNYLNFGDDEIEYNISFYNEAMKIDQNVPLRGTIKKGEIQYFNLYFSKRVENLYVSVTNLMGDVDLFMNYGFEFPNFNNATWVSATPYSEFIEFDKEDNFFVSRNITDVSGNYTIMIYGATNSSYTLYATSHPNKIIAVNDGATASCKSEETEPCYFRYNDFVDDKKEDLDIIISTDYLYGSGSISANLYSNANYEISNDLPSSTKSEFSNIDKSAKNMLKIKIDKNHSNLNINSMLLIVVECKEKCFFELNVSNMFKSDVKYLDVNRENIYYIYKSNLKTILIYYNWSEKDLNLAAFSYMGMAKFRVYLNNTIYDEQGKTKNEIVELKKFFIDYSNTPTFHDTITNDNAALAYRNIFFEVEPITDVGFHLKLNHDKDWTLIKINKVNTYSVNSYTKSFFGYFDILDEYDNTSITVRSLSHNVSITVFLKYVLQDKSYDNFDINKGHTYETPKSGSDLMGKTDPILSSYSAHIPKLSNEKTQGKYSRVLVQLSLSTLTNLSTDGIKFDILVSTNIKGSSLVEAEQEKLIFTQLDNKNPNEIRIYNLKRRLPTDNLLILEISTCMGSIEYKVCDKILYSKTEPCSLVYHHENSDGRKLVVIDLNQTKSENFYISLWHKKQLSRDCTLSNHLEYTCVDKTEATIYYFTTNSRDYKTTFVANKGTLEFETISNDSIQLKWGKMLSESLEELKPSEALYQLYVSQDVFDYEHMDSICYLSRINFVSGKTTITMNNDDTATIGKLESNKKYYVNILAKNLNTNEIIAYRAIEINFEPPSVPIYLIGMKIISKFNSFRIDFDFSTCLLSLLFLQEIQTYKEDPRI